MTVGQFLESATQKLRDNNIETSRLDCLILLEDALGIDRANLIAHPETEISHETEVELNKKVVQRCTHLPLAYIRGHIEFYGRQFIVNQNVLVPRPETETIIDLLLKITQQPKRIADIGSGTGCIGITASLELDTTVDLYDISRQALNIARLNGRKLKANVRLFHSDLLDNLDDSRPYDVFIANLPYVPDNYGVNQAVNHEPRLALFAGEDGMDIYRKLWSQIANLEQSPQYVITESLTFQHQLNNDLAKQAGYQPIDHMGLIQSFRRLHR